jgi:hypothetical protein
LTQEGTTSKGTGSFSCEVEFCIFYRLSLRTLRTKDVAKQLWNSETILLHTFMHIPWVQKSVRTTVGCKIQHKIQNKSAIQSIMKLKVPLNSYTYNS